MTLHFFFINIAWSYCFCPYCFICGNVQILPSTARILKLLMIQSNVYVGDLQSRLYFPPYLWWMSEIPLPLPLNDFNISSPSLFPFIDLVITLPRQGFDFSSEEMSENNHFQWQLTLLAPLSLPHWMCSYPLLILFTTHFQTSHTHQQYLQIHHHIITTELYVHHCHVQYQIAKLLKINHLHHQPVEGHPKKAKLLNNPIICKCRMGGIY